MPTRFDTILTDSLIEKFTSSGDWKNQTLLDHLEHWSAQRPDAIVTRDPTGAHTYAELSSDVETCARALVDLGVEPGDVVGIQLPNWYEWLVIHLGTIKAGAVTNGLIPIYRDREIGYMAKKASVSVLFVPNRFRKFDYRTWSIGCGRTCRSCSTIVLDAPATRPSPVGTASRSGPISSAEANATQHPTVRGRPPRRSNPSIGTNDVGPQRCRTHPLHLGRRASQGRDAHAQ